MRYFVNVDGMEYEVSIKQTETTTLVTLDDEQFAVDFRRDHDYPFVPSS